MPRFDPSKKRRPLTPTVNINDLGGLGLLHEQVATIFGNSPRMPSLHPHLPPAHVREAPGDLLRVEDLHGFRLQLQEAEERFAQKQRDLVTSNIGNPEDLAEMFNALRPGRIHPIRDIRQYITGRRPPRKLPTMLANDPDYQHLMGLSSRLKRSEAWHNSQARRTEGRNYGPYTRALANSKRETEIYHLERMKLDPRNANNTGLPTNPIQYADMAMRHHPRSHTIDEQIARLREQQNAESEQEIQEIDKKFMAMRYDYLHENGGYNPTFDRSSDQFDGQAYRYHMNHITNIKNAQNPFVSGREGYMPLPTTPEQEIEYNEARQPKQPPVTLDQPIYDGKPIPPGYRPGIKGGPPISMKDTSGVPQGYQYVRGDALGTGTIEPIPNYEFVPELPQPKVDKVQDGFPSETPPKEIKPIVDPSVISTPLEEQPIKPLIMQEPVMQEGTVTSLPTPSEATPPVNEAVTTPTETPANPATPTPSYDYYGGVNLVQRRFNKNLMDQRNQFNQNTANQIAAANAQMQLDMKSQQQLGQYYSELKNGLVPKRGIK